ncbi:unnamed protein product [Paramecium sonneborni]|uniref:Uncharacterized protein n=1 Tax=Paramecium sonneborni TaxID=65129 RepID=A0A8S1N3J3_9CILI|nr:unnamed protein product [Paramecium sonneborni]
MHKMKYNLIKGVKVVLKCPNNFALIGNKLKRLYKHTVEESQIL